MSRSSSTIREAIEGSNPSARLARINALELRSVIGRSESNLTHALAIAQGGAVDQASIGFVIGSPVIDELNRCKTALALIEASDAYKIAVETVEPLFEELAEAEARELAEREAITAAEIALRNAREDARQKAEAALAKDGSVKAAQAALDELKAKHPEHVVVPEPPAPSMRDVYEHGEDAARELQADFK